MMVGLESVGKALIVLGILIVLLGVALVFGSRIPYIGRLPGDILIRRRNFTFYFPLVSCLGLSVLLTILLNLIVYLLRR